MAAPDQSAAAAFEEQGPKLGQRGAAPPGQYLGLIRGKQLGLLAERRFVLVEERGERLEPRLGLDGRRCSMRRRHHAAEPVGKRRIDAPLIRQPIERRVLVEPAHLHRPLDRLAAPVDCELAVRLTRDRHDPAIDFGGEGAIDLELGLARRLASLQRRIVEERKAHRALDLEGALPRQEHRGRVGVEAPDRFAAVAGGVGQEAEYGLLVIFGLVHSYRCGRAVRAVGNLDLRQINAVLPYFGQHGAEAGTVRRLGSTRRVA